MSKAATPRPTPCLTVAAALAAMLAFGACAAAPPSAPPATSPATRPASPLWATTAGSRVKSPEVHLDGSVTFRLYAPKASAVSISGEWGLGYKSASLTRDEQGLWSITYDPAPANLYSYSFTVDGVRIIDPRNNQTKPGGELTSVVEVGGEASPYALRPVPHGTIHVHRYHSPLLDTPRRLHVYTPPGYEDQPDTRYPVLYLLHGSGDDDSHWSVFGRANYLLDNLIAEGKARPMIVVMPEGMARPARPTTQPREAPWSPRSTFRAELFQHVIPLVEEHYRAQRDAEHRAIAGLSMGGSQSVQIGLARPDVFAWIGSFSGGLFHSRPDRQLTIVLPSHPQETNARLRLMWISCGKEDFLFAENRDLCDQFARVGVKHVWHPTEGSHCWPLWRENLREFLPLLFR